MKPLQRGITFRSAGILILLLLLMAVSKQYAEVILSIPHPAEHTLPLPAVWVFLLFLAFSGGVYKAFRLRLLSRAELLCVLYALLIAGPIMTQGVWHRLLSITATIPKGGDFGKIDALSEKMWPHGPNLLDGGMVPERITEASNVSWEDVDVSGKGQVLRVPVLRSEGDGAFVRFVLPVGEGGVVPNAPYLISVLAHATGLSPGSSYYGRVYSDPARPELFTSVFQSSAPAAPGFMFPSGFSRRGGYDIRFLPAGGEVAVEFGLSGAGTLVLADPKLMDVSALEQAYKGRRIISVSEAATLSSEDRVDVVVRPDRMLSLEGLEFVLCGYIPVRAWLMTVTAWTTMIVLVLTAVFAMAVLMRRQWVDNERYPLPVKYITDALIGRDGEPPIWKNRMAWSGFGVCMVWCLMRGWNFYNPRVPDMNIDIPLDPYFAESVTLPLWRGVRFNVSAIFLSLAMFMELGVLFSIVAGYFLFRSLYLVGSLTGLSANAGFPFVAEQQFGGYLMYAFLVFVFTRKYWGRVLKAAWKNDLAASEGEAFSYRNALILLVLCFAGAAVWAKWAGVGIAGILVFFLFMVLTGVVSAKIRAECGTPFGYFSPYNGVLVMSMLGGLSVFGASAVLVALMCSFMLFVTAFYLIPGAQVEMLEMGREHRVVPRHLFYAMLAGVVGGMVVGGWVFLSNAYALGGDNMKYNWAFDLKGWYLYGLNHDLTVAGQALSGEAAATTAGIAPATWAYLYAAAGTLVASVLRQLFAGFWFHPVGFFLGSSWFTWYVWGSCLAAWFIRLTVLKLGGAATVRDRLRPFFIGFFLAAALSQLLFSIHAGFLASAGIENVYRAIP